jgi:hypothetical protein
MSLKLKKLFNSIINNETSNTNHDDEYILITNMEDLIKGAHIRIKIASKVLCTGFFIMSKPSLIRDNNMIIIKTDKLYKEIPFYKNKVYQRDLNKYKNQSIFDNKQIRDNYLNNIKKYLNNKNVTDNIIEDKNLYSTNKNII